MLIRSGPSRSRIGGPATLVLVLMLTCAVNASATAAASGALHPTSSHPATTAAITPATRNAPLAEAGRHGHRTKIALPATAKARLLSEMKAAWQITKGGGVTVAVLSTGVVPVTGLTGKLTRGPDYARVANPVYIDGTVLASLIAGAGPSGTDPFGAIGRAPGARVLSIRIVAYGSGAAGRKYQEGGTWQEIEAKAIRYAADHGAKVIVIFESGTGSAPLDLASAVAYALSKNAVIVTAGFYPRGVPAYQEYPDDLPGVINASGTVLRGLPRPRKLERFAADDSVLVTAPANPLYATGPGDLPYTAFDSYSVTAWVAGTVALIKSVYPNISPALVARALALSASYHPAGGYNTRIGFGLINPIGALREAGRLVRLRVVATSGPGVASPASRAGAGPPPGAIAAVHHSAVKLGGFGGMVLAGLVLLVLAFWLARRKRRATIMTAASVAAELPPAAPAMPADAGAERPVMPDEPTGTEPRSITGEYRPPL